MKGEEIVNAKISSTRLGYEDHGIFSADLQLDYGSSGQGFGGIAMDGWNEEKKEREGWPHGITFIGQLLHAVGAETWEALPGLHIRVKRRDGLARAVGHIIENKWFDIDEFIKIKGGE